MKKVLIGIDIGSTNIKTVIFNENLEILANEANEIDIIYPRQGWTEYDPAKWWMYVKETLKRAMNIAGVEPGIVAGIGVSSLGCTSVPLDREGNHLYNAIPWHDQRAGKEVASLEDECREDIFEACGNIPTVLSSTPHIMWLKNNEAEVYRKMYKYTEASGFIVQKLTGKFVLDHSMASALDFGINIDNLAYDENLIKKIGLDIEKYPVLHDNRESVGILSQSVADEIGLIDSIPVYLGGLDIVTATVAVGAVDSGQGFYSMGSASNMMIVADKDAKSPYLTSLLHVINPEKKLLFGSQAAIGFSFKWFSEQFCKQEKLAAELLEQDINVFEIMSRKAEKVLPGSGGIIYLPYLFGKFHPIFNPDATGVFFGITATSTRAQMIRAVMEGCTYSMNETIKSAEDIGIHLDEIITSGGPAQSEMWCQIIADVTGKVIKILKTPEATPLGNAIIAGLGENIWDSYEDVITKKVIFKKEYKPNPDNTAIYKDLFGIYKLLDESLLPVFEKMEEFKAGRMIEST